MYIKCIITIAVLLSAIYLNSCARTSVENILVSQTETDKETTVETTKLPEGASNYNDFSIINENGSVWLRGYNGSAVDLVIPGEINGIPVKGIIQGDFGYDSNIESITIPESVIDFFSEIDENSKRMLSKKLLNIYVDEDNPVYMSIDGVLIRKEKMILEYYPLGRSDITYIVSEGVKNISSLALYENQVLEEIILPDTISPSALASLNGLTSLKKIWINTVSIDYFKENNIENPDEWLDSCGMDPKKVAVYFNDCVYANNPDLRINENKYEYVKLSQSDISEPQYPAEIRLINPDLTETGTLTVTEGTINMLAVEFEPLTASNTFLKFVSDDQKIIKTDGQLIYALKEGETTVKAYAENGVSAVVKVIVRPSAYDYEKLKNALNSLDTKIVSMYNKYELLDLNFDGMPELIIHSNGPASRFSYNVNVFSLTDDTYKLLYEVEGGGRFELMIDNRTAEKSYYFNAYINDFDKNFERDGLEGDYIVKINKDFKNNDSVYFGSAVLGRASDTHYYGDDQYYYYIDKIGNQKYITEDIKVYAGYYNNFYRDCTPLTQVCSEEELSTDFFTGEPIEDPDTVFNSLVDKYNNTIKTADTTLTDNTENEYFFIHEQRAIKFSEMYIILETGESYKPDIVYSPLYELPFDEINNFNIEWLSSDDEYVSVDKYGTIKKLNRYDASISLIIKKENLFEYKSFLYGTHSP